MDRQLLRFEVYIVRLKERVIYSLAPRPGYGPRQNPGEDAPTSISEK